MPNRQVNPHQVERAMERNRIEERLLRQVTTEPLLDLEHAAHHSAVRPKSEEPNYRITPIQNQILPCPICHRSGRHTSRIYPDYEINTCVIDPQNHHSWRIDYKQVGREFYETIKEDMTQVVALVNEMQGMINEFGAKWGKSVKARDSRQIEKIGRMLHFLRGMLDNSGDTTLRETLSEVGGKIEIVTAQQFQRVIDGRLYIGARLFVTAEDAARASNHVLREYFIRPRMASIPASELCSVERYILALPRDPRNDLEATFISVARSWLENLPGNEYPVPPTPMVSMIFPYLEATEPESDEARVDRRKKNNPEEFKRNGYRGLVWCESHENALKKAWYLRNESNVSVRAVVVNSNSDYPDPRHLLMIPANTDGETIELLHLWLESPSDLEPSKEVRHPRRHDDVSSYMIKSGGEIFKGLVETENQAKARELALRMKRELGVAIRCRNYPLQDNPQRHVVMVPNRLDPETMKVIELWLQA